MTVAANAQIAAPVTVRPGVTLPPGSIILNPGAKLQIVRPPSGSPGPGRAGTNVEILIPRGGYPSGVNPAGAPPQSGELYQTPASLGCIYGLVTATKGCNPNLVTINPSGGSKAIAIVDAYDLTTAATDLAKFDAQFGIGGATFTKVYGTGKPSAGCKSGSAPPNADGTGWDVEEDLDIEYAHAMAPKAHLYLVEANSNSYADLFNAEQVAAACVEAAGGGQVSNSWGGGEYSGENEYDKYFTGKNVVFYVSTGDSSYPEYPAVSPDVVSVGGTTLSYSTSGVYQGQASWSPLPDFYGYEDSTLGEGAGPGVYETTPSYQKLGGVAKIVGKTRAVPDITAVGDPATGVWIYNTDSYFGWTVIGGTSVATPVNAGIANHNGDFFASTSAYLTQLYTLGTEGKLAPYFAKMNQGLCGAPSEGTYASLGGNIDPEYEAALGAVTYNECGGWGSPSSTKTFAVAGPPS